MHVGVAERSGHVALGFDLGLIGFAEGELERLLAGGKEGLTDDDHAPPLPEQAVTQPGDLWVLGEHRLLCGDATALADIERVLGGQLADMTFTDPPLVACPRQSAPEASDGGTPTAVAGTGGLRSGLSVSPGLRRARRAEGESPPLSKDSQLGETVPFGAAAHSYGAGPSGDQPGANGFLRCGWMRNGARRCSPSAAGPKWAVR